MKACNHADASALGGAAQAVSHYGPDLERLVARAEHPDPPQRATVPELSALLAAMRVGLDLEEGVNSS
jgi:hypothetical protein